MDNEYFNILLQNTTSSVQKVVSENNLKFPIIRDASQYELGITKFALPVQYIECFKISDASQYQITQSQLVPVYTSSGGIDDVSNVLLSTTTSLLDSNAYPMINQEDVIENVNRAFMRVHRDFIALYNPYYSNVQTQTVAINYSDAATYTSATNFKYTKQFSFANTSPANYSNLGYLTVSLSLYNEDFYVLGSHGHTNMTYEVFITDQNSNTVQLFSNHQTQNGNLVFSSRTQQTIVFDDSYIKSYEDQYNINVVPAVNSTTYCHPRNSFISFYDKVQTGGNWTLTVIACQPIKNEVIVSDQAFPFVDATITAYFVPTYSQSLGHAVCKPVYVDIAQQNGSNFLRLNIDEKAAYHNARYYLSPSLNNILGFESVFYSPNYMLSYGQVIYSSQTDMYIQIIQRVSTLFKMISIREIQFITNNIPTHGEITNDNLKSNSVIASFNPSTNTLKDIYEYYSTSSWRYYSLQNSQPIDIIDIRVDILYSTGEIETATIQPNETFQCQLHFRKKLPYIIR